MEVFKEYIRKLGFEDVFEQNIRVNKANYIYVYETKLKKNNNEKVKIPFVAYKNEETLFNYHLEEWNKNELDFFIAVGTEQSCIIKVKEKPNKEKPLYKNILLGGKSFDYGTNTLGYTDIIPYTKEKLDNSFFFDFVFRQQEKIRNEVDTHLLNNLIALKVELEKFDSNSENINFLILKCLFVKYLEDRNIVSNSLFHDVLETENIEGLQNTFKTISIINGDILKQKIHITENHIKHLNYFFTYDYKVFVEKGQASLFYPYKFDKIPIQLISNIYEEFLGRTNKEEKKKKGIFYTRSFVVDFMLSQKIYSRLDVEDMLTVLDPACGSGAFLVQAFRRILNKPQNRILSIDEKAILLKKQIFGIDIDENALHITAFSLYLTLLEGITEEEVKRQIEKSNPILPSLIGSNLIQGNTITDEIKFEIEINNNGLKEKITYTKFDCIVANPPWSELKKKDIQHDEKVRRTRESIESLAIYENVDRYQTSQAFLLKINEVCKKNSNISIIVNNSIFLNEGSKGFREEILKKYRVNSFYELSEIAPILFKKTNHPCAVLILDKQKITNHTIRYITPRLTRFNKRLRTISYSTKDIKEVKQKDLQVEDILWRIFVNGNWEDYQLITKIALKRDENIKAQCAVGIKPTGATPLGLPNWKKRINAKDLTRYHIEEDSLTDFNINQEFDRARKGNYDNIFKGLRVLIKRTPSPRDGLKLVCAMTDKELVFMDHLISLKFSNPKLCNTYNFILNSSLFGYYFNQTSSQTNKGKKQSAIKTKEIENLPFINLSISQEKEMDLNRLRNNLEEDKLDEFIFKLYGLLEFEKEIIREFYQTNVERKNDFVKWMDLQTYVSKFRDSYQLMVKDDLRLNASCILSSNIGVVLKFEIVSISNFVEEVTLGKSIDRQVLQLVKEKQLQEEQLKGYIYEEKVKFYKGESFYIVKSNQFKDWTKKQAMDDAREEIHEMIKKLQ